MCPGRQFQSHFLDIEIATIPPFHSQACTRSAIEDVWVNLCMDKPIDMDEAVIRQSQNSTKITAISSSAARFTGQINGEWWMVNEQCRGRLEARRAGG